MSHPWSPLQEDIFDFLETSRRSLLVQAVAGSGKTTTIVEGANRIPVDKAACFLAFNKSIQLELGERLPSHFEAKTLNSLGFGACLKQFRAMGRRISNPMDVMDEKKCQRILFEEFDRSEDVKKDRQAVLETVALAKSYALRPEDPSERWQRMIEHHDVYTEELPIWELIKAAKVVLRESNEYLDFIDFNDQIYLPIIKGWAVRRYDVLFVDEAQDLSAAQRLLLKKALRPGGRVVAVGDRAQAIYGWRGASHDSMDQIGAMFHCEELPLSICYRCPTKVIEEAQKIVPEIQARDDAPEGEIAVWPQYTADMFEPTDLIVCRNNAPTISLAYALISKRVACRVMGRDIGEGLVNLIRRFETDDIPELRRKLVEWSDKEIRQLLKMERQRAADTVRDKTETIEVIIASSPSETVSDLMAEIKELFRSDEQLRKEPQMVTLATVHKAKGLEAPRVFILERDLMPAQWARQDWEQIQERNLIYVATTRPQHGLYYISVRGLVDDLPREEEPEEGSAEEETAPIAAEPPAKPGTLTCGQCSVVYTPSQTSWEGRCGNCHQVTICG